MPLFLARHPDAVGPLLANLKAKAVVGGQGPSPAGLVARLPVEFVLRVEVAGPDDDPHDPMAVWRGSRTFEAGVLTITAPLPDPEADGGLVVFDPSRVVAGVGLSDDPILRFRPSAYSASPVRRSE